MESTRKKPTDGRQALDESGGRLATYVLESRGYSLVERSFLCLAGEIDVVAAHSMRRAGWRPFVYTSTRLLNERARQKQ